MVNMIGRIGPAVALCAAAGLVVSDESGHVLVPADEIRWGPASPKLPPGAEIVVLKGSPSLPGSQYVFRAKLPDGYSVPPHWHPEDENVTVLKGLFKLGFGERLEDAALRELGPGSFVTLPKHMPHYNRMAGETILQFHGIGPYDIVYVNPADDPSIRE